MKDLKAENALAHARESSEKGRAAWLKTRLVKAKCVIAAHKATIRDLQFCLDGARIAFPLLCKELSYVHLVRDDA